MNTEQATNVALELTRLVVEKNLGLKPAERPEDKVFIRSKDDVAEVYKAMYRSVVEVWAEVRKG